MVSAENVLQMKDGMEKSVSVSLITLKSMEFVGHAILTPITMVETVFATMDSMEMLINATNVMNPVDNALALKLISV